jgi:hypothetical protein
MDGWRGVASASAAAMKIHLRHDLFLRCASS